MVNTFCGLMPRDTYCMRPEAPVEDKKKNIVVNYYCEQSISNKIHVPRRAGSADFTKGETSWDNDIIKIRNLSLNQHYPLVVVDGGFNKK